MSNEPECTRDKSLECGATIFKFVQFAIRGNKYNPADIAKGLLKAYLSVLAAYAEPQHIPSMIQEACDYLKEVRVLKDGEIHTGNGEIH
jgi:hypothetical protein